jgi:peptidoglycan hydrolase-like protein with peptidoglycan-binding domain
MTKRILKTVPKLGDVSDDVQLLQGALADKGFSCVPDSWRQFNRGTQAALKAFQKSKGLPGSGLIPSSGGKTFEYLGLELEKKEDTTPWLTAVKKYSGLSETNPVLVKVIAPMWKKVGLGYKDLSGSARAWCAIGVVFGLFSTGYVYVSKRGASAAQQGQVGQAIDYKKNGIPKGAIVHVNSKECGSGSGNHITFADGDCAAKDFIEMVKNSKGVWVQKIKSGTTFPGYGGNQGNKFKRSWYKIASICHVRWPDKKTDGTREELPPPVKVSNGCNGKPATGESTR